ncbi:MAG: hypothetical protein KKI08_21515 [Armatimonadetes bacterium]|nr:hypothetical protein [Armatimonadota bacterium]
MLKRRRKNSCAGQTMAEYILIIVGVTLVLLAPLNLLADSLKNFLERSRESLCTIVKGTPGGNPPR